VGWSTTPTARDLGERFLGHWLRDGDVGLSALEGDSEPPSTEIGLRGYLRKAWRNPKCSMLFPSTIPPSGWDLLAVVRMKNVFSKRPIVNYRTAEAVASCFNDEARSPMEGRLRGS